MECEDYSSDIGCTWTSSNMLCKWKDGKCSALEKCEDIDEKNKICDGYSSLKGMCFYNGIIENNFKGRFCFAKEDITNCSEFNTKDICSNANVNDYTNLISHSSLVIFCTWNSEYEVCRETDVTITPNDSNHNDDSPKDENEKDDLSKSTSFILIIIIAVVVVVVLMVIIIVVIILYRKRVGSRLKGSEDNENKNVFEMDSVRPSSSVTTKTSETRRETGFKYLIFWKKEYFLYITVVRGENTMNEYIVGDVIGNYEIKGMVGRGVYENFLMSLFF
jgi:hypothetical protein